jgi:Glucose-6-phosphate 1-dehydrogenase
MPEPRSTLPDHREAGSPCTFVIFGASGDLTKRKLIPSLFNLQCLGLLPDRFAVIGVAITPGDDDAFRTQLSAEIKQFATHPVDPSAWAAFWRAATILPAISIRPPSSRP